MQNQLPRKHRSGWLAAVILLGGVYSCGSGSDTGAGGGSGGGAGTGKANGAACTADAECISGVCTDNVCVGNGTGAPAGSPCSADGECASGSCVDGLCSAGSDLPDGASCAAASECASGKCTDGVCGGSSTGSGGSPGAGGATGTAGAAGGGGTAGAYVGFCVIGALGCPCDALGECGFGLECNDTTCCDTETGNCTPPPSAGGGTTGEGGAGGSTICTPGVNGPVIYDCGYPYESDNPLTNVAFNESTVLRAIFPSGGAPLASVRMFYNDEHALTLGVRQVDVISASGTETTEYDVSPLDANPDSVRVPDTGTNLTSGDQSGLDPSARPMWPSLYVTDITNDPNNRAGDWQEGGTPWNPSAIYGTWKSAIRTVDTTVDPNLTSITPDVDPAKNTWNLGPDADPIPADAMAGKAEGYGAEVRWDLVLVAGHNYRIQVMVHDGDQNKVGGDSGEACVNFCADAACPEGKLPCGPDSPCPITTESACVAGCCL